MSEQLPTLQLPKSALQQLSQSLGLHTVVVTCLALLMLIPLFFAKNVVKTRQAAHETALNTVAERWGGKQTLVGPVLVVPYVEHFTNVDTINDENGESRVISKDVFNDRTAILLPESLEIRANLNEEHQRQGIHDALVYNATISLSGTFNHAPVLQSGDGERRILWNKAFIALGLTDQRAVDTASSFFWNNGRIDMQPGTRLNALLPAGFHIPLKVNADSNPNNEFKLTLTLRGSDGLFFAPLGQTTTIRMTSAWRHPRFEGDLLPNKHDITEAGFNASWDIPHLVRNYPQHWVLEDQQTYNLHSFSAGVSLHEPDSVYTLIERTMRYGALLVGMVFWVFLALEIRLKQRLHTLQYGLIGVALSLFYLILLAAAEHIDFLYAYVVAAATTILSITVYTGIIFRHGRETFLLCLLLVLLYGSLYVLLQREDYALLISVGLLLFATVLMMHVTRHLLSTSQA